MLAYCRQRQYWLCIRYRSFPLLQARWPNACNEVKTVSSAGGHYRPQQPLQSCQPRWLLQLRVVRYLPGMTLANPSDEAVRRQSGAPSRA